MINPKIFIFLLLISIHCSFAQKRDDGVFFVQEDQIAKFHTIGELENLRKGDLIKLYKDRIQEIITVVPFVALTNEANVRLSDVGIKEDSDHLKTLKKGTEATRESLEIMEETVDNLVPYADTERIIWSILYYEEIIKKMRIGVQNSF